LRVELVVADPADIIRRYYPNGKLGGLTIDGPAPSALGQLVELCVKIQNPPREFDVKGQLAWARHKSAGNLKGCFGIDFSDESSQRLLAFARSDFGPEALRSAPRLATDLSVKITHQGKTRREVLADLSEGGAFVRSPQPAEIGDMLEVHLRPPGSLTSILLNARVAWIRPTGDAPGMGLEFFEVDPKAMLRLGKVLAQLARP
jgi:uncharacterized protein (TIGR02266 family)